MPFPWSKSDRPEGEPAGEMQDLCRHLQRLGEQVAEANRQVTAYLLRRESQSAVAPVASPSASSSGVSADGAASLREKVDGLGSRVDELGRQQAALGEAVRSLQEQLDRGFQQMAELLGPRETQSPGAPAIVTAESSPQPAVSGSEWERAVLGPALASDPRLAFQRQQFLQGVLEGNPGARALAGSLLIFQSSPPERLPQLLKDIGEAYYRWQPKTRPGRTPMEEVLASWLQSACEAAGIRNTIELVEPGERFDTIRHTADSRGVEIVEVRGWIVLRDNGKVYTKANVAVR